VWRHAATQFWVEQAGGGTLGRVEVQCVGCAAEEQRRALYTDRSGEAKGLRAASIPSCTGELAHGRRYVRQASTGVACRGKSYPVRRCQQGRARLCERLLSPDAHRCGWSHFAVMRAAGFCWARDGRARQGAHRISGSGGRLPGREGSRDGAGGGHVEQTGPGWRRSPGAS